MKTKLLALTLLAGGSMFAQTPWMEWGDTGVQTKSVQTCMSFATDAMRSLNMQIVPPTGAYVIIGARGGTTAAITCRGNGNDQADAVTVVAGDNKAETSMVLTALTDTLVKMITID